MRRRLLLGCVLVGVVGFLALTTPAPSRQPVAEWSVALADPQGCSVLPPPFPTPWVRCTPTPAPTRPPATATPRPTATPIRPTPTTPPTATPTAPPGPTATPSPTPPPGVPIIEIAQSALTISVKVQNAPVGGIGRIRLVNSVGTILASGDTIPIPTSTYQFMSLMLVQPGYLGSTIQLQLFDKNGTLVLTKEKPWPQ